MKLILIKFFLVISCCMSMSCVSVKRYELEVKKSQTLNKQNNQLVKLLIRENSDLIDLKTELANEIIISQKLKVDSIQNSALIEDLAFKNKLLVDSTMILKARIKNTQKSNSFKSFSSDEKQAKLLQTNREEFYKKNLSAMLEQEKKINRLTQEIKIKEEKLKNSSIYRQNIPDSNVNSSSFLSVENGELAVSLDKVVLFKSGLLKWFDKKIRSK